MSSGSELSPINEPGKVNTMIALLVPERFMNCMSWCGAKLDVGMSFLKCLKSLGENECAIELGGQTYSLSMEMVYAQAEDMAASACPPISGTASSNLASSHMNL